MCTHTRPMHLFLGLRNVIDKLKKTSMIVWFLIFWSAHDFNNSCAPRLDKIYQLFGESCSDYNCIFLVNINHLKSSSSTSTTWCRICTRSIYIYTYFHLSLPHRYGHIWGNTFYPFSHPLRIFTISNDLNAVLLNMPVFHHNTFYLFSSSDGGLAKVFTNTH
jgi:hypothetical protein